MVGNRVPTVGSSAESPRLRRRHSFGLGVVVGLAISAILGLVLVAPIALAHHDASSLETAYGNAVITGSRVSMQAQGVPPAGGPGGAPGGDTTLTDAFKGITTDGA